MINAIDIYRVGNKAYRKNIPVIPKIMFRLNYLLFHCVVPSECEIGEKSRFAYGGMNVVIHKAVTIGEHCLIGQGITIGGKPEKSAWGGVPTIGDNCYISAGARIIGDVRIGDNCVVGANAVVTHDVPDNCVVAGVPARVIREDIDVSDYRKEY